MLSHPLLELTNALRRSLTWARLATGACWVTAVTLAAASVLGLADYLFHHVDPGLRLISSTALFGIAAWSIWRFLLPVWTRPLTLLGVARRIEQRFPQLNDRLASSIDFLHQRPEDPTAGSPTLRRAVVADTAAAVQGLPFHTIVDHRPLRRAGRIAGALVLILLVAVLVDVRAVGIAARRLIAPLGSTQWPRRHHLQFRATPSQLATGQTFEVELVDLGGGDLPDEVLFHIRYRREGQLHSETEPMQRIGDLMVSRREGVDRSFEFRATGGDDQEMPWHAVEVVEPPRVADIRITAQPPTYTGIPPLTVERDLRVIAGTQLELSATASQLLLAARVLVGEGESIEADLTFGNASAGPTQLRIPRDRWIAEKSGEYRIELESKDRLIGHSERWKLQVIADPPPSVTWHQPRAGMFVLPSAIVPVEVAVNDNLRIQTVAIVYDRSDRPDDSAQSFTIYSGPDLVPPVSADALDELTESRQVAFEWDLAPLGIPVGNHLTVSARAADYGRGWGETPSPRRITIISRDELDQRVADALARIARQLAQLQVSQRRLRDQVTRVEIQASRVGRIGKSDLDSLQTALLAQRRLTSELVDADVGMPVQVSSLIAELEANRLALSDVHRRLWRLQTALAALADSPLPEIHQQLTTANKAARSLLRDVTDLKVDEAAPQHLTRIQEALERAGSDQETVIHRLEDLLDNLGEWAGAEQFARELADLRKGQLVLKREAEQAIRDVHTDHRSPQAAQERADVAKLVDGQSDLSRRFEKLMHDIEQASQRIASEEATPGHSLADAAETARDQQTAARLREATGELRQRRVGRARQLQQQIADDLEEILHTLRNRRSEHKQSPHQVARLEAMLKSAVDRQQTLLHETQAWDKLLEETDELTFAQSRDVLQLAESQASLGSEIRDAAQSLDRMIVFHLALNGAAGDMQRAAELLYERNTSIATQESERQALERLKHILAALAEDSSPSQEEQGRGGAGTGGEQQPQGPQVDIAELKLLRLLQADLNLRTRQAEEQLVEHTASGDEVSLAVARHEAENLASEQGRLAELLLEMFSRDNEAAVAPDTEEQSP